MGLYYHFDNIGSTTLLTNQDGTVADRFVYGTYGELLSEVTKKVRFLCNGAYGVATDDNGLYYMRARYYNPDIKRFINQDIKVGDIINAALYAKEGDWGNAALCAASAIPAIGAAIAGSAFIKYGGKITGGARQTQGTPLQIILRKVGGQ